MMASAGTKSGGTVDFQISVIKLSNIQSSHRWHEPNQLVSLQVDGREYKTTPSPVGTVVNGSFIIPANRSSSVEIRLHCIHQKLKENHVICETEDLHILGAARNQDIVMKWRKPGSKTDRDRGSVTIRILVDTTFHPTTAIVQGSLQLRSTGGLANLEVMINRLHEIKNSPPQWASLMMSLNNLVLLTGSLAELDPNAKAAFTAVAFAFEMVMKQAERDERINHLVAVMASLYSFLQDANPLEKIVSLEQSVMRLVKQTTECAYFISDYTKAGSFAQRAVTGIVFDVDSIITGYEAIFGELKIEFIMGSTLQTALMTVRILKKVDRIGNQLLLGHLPYIENASWNPDRVCLRGTCTSIIDDIDHWVVSGVPPGQDRACQVFLLLGPPQSGKSSISHTVAQRYEKDRLGSAIFFARDIDDRNRSQKIFSTIAQDLGAFDDSMAEAISGPLARRPALRTATIRRQFQELILEPIRDLIFVGPILIILDGLDECDDRDVLLRIIKEEFVHLPHNFRILITSRSETDIVASLRGPDHCYVRDITFDDGSPGKEMHTYISEKFSELQSNRPSIFTEQHKKDIVQHELVRRAMGINAWATTACKFLSVISDEKAAVFFDSLFSKLIPQDPETALDHLYHSTVYTVSRSTPSDVDRREPVVSAQPSVSGLTGADRTSFRKTGREIGPIDALLSTGCIYVQLNDDGSRRGVIFDRLFEYFITDKRRCTSITGQSMVEDCLCVMNDFLTFNMLGLEDISLSNVEIPEKDKRINEHVPQALQYAVQYWATIIADIEPSMVVMEMLHEFLFDHLLHWIELASLLGIYDTVLPSLESLDEWLKRHKCANSDLTTIVYDAIRFVQTFSDVISEVAQHTYISALAFTPHRTLLYQNYYGRDHVQQPEVIEGAEKFWPHNKTLSGHTDWVISVAFSHNGLLIVSGSRDQTIRIWDAQKYVIVNVINARNWIGCVAFSPDDSRVVSGLADHTVRVWDIHTEADLYDPFRGHMNRVYSVTYSPDGSRILSGPSDGEIFVWDTATGKRVGRSLAGHTSVIERIVFAPDGLQFASGSEDGTVRLWDSQKLECIGQPIQHGNRDSVSDVAWSPDGSLIASSGTTFIILWDSNTREMRRKIDYIYGLPIWSITFSPDASKLFGGSDDGVLHMWDVKTGDRIGGLIAHSESINSVAVSPNGLKVISGSRDKTIRISDMLPYHILHSPTMETLPLSPMPYSVDIDTSRGIDDHGWIYTSAGKRYLWVPSPSRHKATVWVGSDSFYIQYHREFYDSNGRQQRLKMVLKVR